jgi:alpha-glucuronidase
VARYDRGVATAAQLKQQWQALRVHVDARRFDEVAQHLAQQEAEALWWRDASVAYFKQASGLPLPPGARKPPLTLDAYRAIRFTFAPGCGG